MEPERGAPEPPGSEQIESLVRSLVDTMRSGGVSELDLAFGSVTIRLRAASGALRHAATAVPAIVELPAAARETSADDYITAPMVGTYYASPAPGSPPFINEGDAIRPGQVIGIIEAMKIMNEITADRAGVVDAILVTNAQAVEYGSPLVRLRPAD
ncbi:MAG TPA: biotin/lipoyl-containing protein [Thermomicrobiales bacterium]|nr:biotin/lipoyl-containing protein [Thermomicrobiales bacterium]